MAIEIYDENKLRELSDEDRFQACEQILKNEEDESKRWDAVWLIGELAEGKTEKDPMFNKVADVIEWVMKHDNNGIVKHEAAFQIALDNGLKVFPVDVGELGCMEIDTIKDFEDAAKFLTDKID